MRIVHTGLCFAEKNNSIYRLELCPFSILSLLRSFIFYHAEEEKTRTHLDIFISLKKEPFQIQIDKLVKILLDLFLPILLTKFLHIHFTPILYSKQLTNHRNAVCAINVMAFHTGHIFSAVAHFSIPSLVRSFVRSLASIYFCAILSNASPVFVCLFFFSFTFFSFSNSFQFVYTHSFTYAQIHKFTQLLYTHIRNAHWYYTNTLETIPNKKMNW